LQGEVIKNPVIDREGNSYEKEAIEQWLNRNETSPITRNPLKISFLIPNRALKSLIEEASTIRKKASDRQYLNPQELAALAINLPKGDKHKQKFKDISGRSAVYIGELVDGFRNGLGVCNYKSGEAYEGKTKKKYTYIIYTVFFSSLLHFMVLKNYI
jgi:hypothetical protein